MKALARYGFFMLILSGAIGIPLNSFAQDYGHEWIDFNKSYYKLTVAEDGLYRLNYNDLLAAGFPVTTIDPRKIQLFYRGEEQAIYIEGQGDAVFNTTDFILFYGQRNDATLNARLFQPEAAQPHTLYNIYTDTSAYFLTYNLATGNGKRMDTFFENNTGGLPAEMSHNNHRILINKEQYSAGRAFNTQDVTKYSFFDYGEGWTGAQVQEGALITYTLTGLTQTVQASGTPTLEILLVGRDNVSHAAEISIAPDGSTFRSLGTAQFFNYEAYKFTSALNWSDISATGEIVVKIAALGVSGNNDRLSASYVRVVYPRNFDMQSRTSQLFRLPPKVGNKSYVEISNPPSAVQLYDITDKNNIIRIINYNTIGNVINFMVDNTLNGSEVYAVNTTKSVPKIKKVNFRNINPAQPDYIIISNKRLRKPTANLNDPVKAYGGYRASAVGGAYDTLVMDIDVLYNQFNYGESSPLAVFDFMRYLVDNGNPAFLFLIGKGLEPAENFYRNTLGYFPKTVATTGAFYEIRDLVPAAGNPGSDIMYTAGLGGTQYEPAVPVGRLPALLPSQVEAYLNKIQETEALPYNALWRKKVLHLSGGIAAAELVKFRSYTDGFATVARDKYFGGNVTTVSKQTSSTVELINVAEQVNEGVNLITFYGHSAPSVTDIDIGYATDPLQNYNNIGKYPVFLINGCNAGQFFNKDVLFGEDWVLASNKGALGFIAHSSFGFESNLKRYTDTFYSIAYGDSIFINKSIGEVHKEVAKRYIENNGATSINITQVQQMVLLGDPAFHLFGAKKPDYQIENTSLSVTSFNADPVNALSDSFAVEVIVKNFGRTREDSIKVRLTRTLSDNSMITYDTVYAPVYYQDTLVIVVNNEGLKAAGTNQFMVTLDYLNDIDELNEGNNMGMLSFFIPLFGTKNLYPNNFSIVNTQPTKLWVQASDITQGVRDFIIEIDTVKTFDSPFKKQNIINTKLLATWQVDLLPNIPANDSTVYYWRSKFAMALEGESDEWVTSSFLYIKDGPEGWSQSRFAQYDDNPLAGLERNIGQETLDFEKTATDIFIRTYGSDNLALPADVSVKLNGAEYIVANETPCRDNTINFIVFNKNTSVPYAPIPFVFNDLRTCGRSPQLINSFRFSDLEISGQGIVACIDNIGQGDSVIMFSIGDPSFQSWSATVRAKLEEIGASVPELSALQNGEPYILLGKKGAAPGAAVEIKAGTTPTKEQEIQLAETVTGILASGKMNSPVIGPATQWQSLVNSIAISEMPQTDVVGIDVIGIMLDGSEVLLKAAQTLGTVDLSDINAEIYPYIKLQYNTTDGENLTAAQLRKWQVLYTGVPEGILLIKENHSVSTNKAEGDKLENDYGFLNISEKNFPDSLQVNYTTFNAGTRVEDAKQMKIISPLPGDTTDFSIAINTLNKVGKNDYNVFVNPNIVLEQYYDNNQLDLREYLIVNRDNINPSLDVVFDGRYILDGDIVSPTPLISMRLKDENQILFKEDTTGVNIFLKEGCEGCVFKRIAFSSPQVQWFPADEENDFRIEYRPEKLENGLYALRVDATDASGNSAGEEPYAINFQVINESSVTNFYPYPNPFSSSTRFIYTLTGSETPDEIKIQIMTISGKVVREITQDELGIVRIGNNISDYAWDGKDEFGDQLANGVYLYRVIIKQNGEAIEHRETAADRAFKKGFGKLYLLR